MHHSRAVLLVSVIAVQASCTSDADCASLGDKFVELYGQSLSEESRKLDPTVVANAAEAGREQVVEQCKREGFSRMSIKRCLDATTMEEFKKC